MSEPINSVGRLIFTLGAVIILLFVMDIFPKKDVLGISGHASGSITLCINRQPEINMSCNSTAYVSVSYNCTVNASGRDLDENVTYFDNTTLFNISSTGGINFTPDSGVIGNATILISVEDNSSCSNNRSRSSFTLNISERICGDTVCNTNETCSTCSADCGACAATPQTAATPAVEQADETRNTPSPAGVAKAKEAQAKKAEKSEQRKKEADQGKAESQAQGEEKRKPKVEKPAKVGLTQRTAEAGASWTGQAMDITKQLAVAIKENASRPIVMISLMIIISGIIVYKTRQWAKRGKKKPPAKKKQFKSS